MPPPVVMGGGRRKGFIMKYKIELQQTGMANAVIAEEVSDDNLSLHQWKAEYKYEIHALKIKRYIFLTRPTKRHGWHVGAGIKAVPPPPPELCEMIIAEFIKDLKVVW